MSKSSERRVPVNPDYFTYGRPIRPTVKGLRVLTSRYQAGESTEGLAEELGVSAWWIVKTLRENGVSIRCQGNATLTSEQRTEVIRLYLSGTAMCQLAKQFHINKSGVSQLLHRRGVEIRPLAIAKRSHSLRDDAFDELTEEARYWIGFLMADGCVHGKPEQTPRISLGVAEPDLPHLLRFRRFLGSSHRVYQGKGGHCNGYKCLPTCMLTVTSSRLAERLASFGVLPRKSLTAKVEQLESDRHFWRGAVDGDGWVTLQTTKGYTFPLIGLVGSLQLVEQFYEFVLSIGCVMKAKPNKQMNIWCFRTAGTFALQMVQHLYADCEVALPRKHRIAREILQWKPKRAARNNG